MATGKYFQGKRIILLFSSFLIQTSSFLKSSKISGKAGYIKAPYRINNRIAHLIRLLNSPVGLPAGLFYIFELQLCYEIPILEDSLKGKIIYIVFHFVP